MLDGPDPWSLSVSSVPSDVVHQRVRRSTSTSRALVATAVAALFAAISCSPSDGGTTDTSANETTATATSPTTGPPTDQATGIPAGYKDGIAEGKARYPNIGSTGQGDFEWECPLTDVVQVDGRSMDEVTTTSFARLADGVHEISCDFYPPTPVTLRFAMAENEAAYGELVESTGAFKQRGNEQVEDAVTIGERTFTTVTWTYPTNPKAGTKHVACYLDEAMRGRVCVDVHDSDERSDGYHARQTAEELSAILSA